VLAYVRHAVLVISPRGPMVTRRMAAYWGVLAATALTAAVTAALAATITVFLGQGLPLAVQHDLAAAPDTAMSVTAQVTDPSQAVQGSAALRSRITAAMPGVPLSFQQAFWSDPLGFVPGALPASPASAGKGNTALLQAASMSGIASHAVLIAGRWPAAPSSGQRVIPAALPSSAAALLHVGVGDVLGLRDRLTNALVSFDITGVFVRRQQAGPASSFWTLSYIPASGISASGESATYGPLLVSPAAFGPALAMLSGSWVAQPDMTAVPDGSLSLIAARVSALSDPLPDSALLNGTQLTTGLPSVLTATGSDLDVARSLLVISVLQLLVLAVAALLGAGRLLAAQREAEIAMLIARGATRSQLARLTAAEVVPLLALVSAAGALAGARLASALVGAGPLGTAGIRLAGTWPDAMGAAIAVAVIASAALLAPGMTSPAATEEENGRQTVVAGVTRAGLDIALLVLAVLAGWQLRQYSALSDNGTAGIDPVLALAPALALGAGAVVTLRLLPLAARTADRLAARGRRLTASLASWQFSRMPVRQGSVALLLIMAVAAGTLALAQHASWTRSAADQAAFAAGADLQVDLPAPLDPGATGPVAAAAGVTHSMAVTADIGASPGEVIAVDAAQAAPVVRLRGDESPLPPGRLFRAITPSADLPGAVLPAAGPGARPGTFQLTATLTPAGQLGPVTVNLTIIDRAGSGYQFTWTFAADGRPHVLAASLDGKSALYPLRVAAITASFSLPLQAGPFAALTLSGLSLAGWTEDASSAALTGIEAQGSLLGQGALPQAGSADVTGRAATFTFSPGYASAGLLASPEQPIQGQLELLPLAARAAAIPAIATRAFMDANSLTIGSVVPVFLEGAQVPLRIVAEVASFPTATAPGGALITDLGSVQEYLAWQSVAPLPVMQWWLTTPGGAIPPALAASVPAGSGIISSAGLAKAITGDPLSAAPQTALLSMAAAAALLAITGFWVSIAADVRQRRAETALLAALGVTRRDTALRLCLEKVLLSLPSAALGVLLGTLVARLLVPAVTLTSSAQQPVPPALTLYDLPQVIPLALVVAVLPAVTAVLAATRRPDPAAELRAAQAA
jgi:hypothetical protein